jgi:hypothetical protein
MFDFTEEPRGREAKREARRVPHTFAVFECVGSLQLRRVPLDKDEGFVKV